MKRCEYLVPNQKDGKPARGQVPCGEPATWNRFWMGYNRCYCDKHKAKTEDNAKGATWTRL